MKNTIFLRNIFALLMIGVLSMSFTFSTTQRQLPAKWEKLGQKVVNHKVDRDVVSVTYKEGKFSKLKLKVLRSGLNMHKMVVHFSNGQTQNVALKKNFSKGGESRVIDINGGRRVIKKVVFYYDAKSVMNKNKAVVVLFGRH